MEYPQLFSKGGLIPCVYCGTIIKVSLTRISSTIEINGKQCYCCGQCLLLDSSKEFDRKVIEKNKLSNTLWKEKYGNLKRGKCEVCDIKISKYYFRTWFKLFFDGIGNWEKDNLDIVCINCHSSLRYNCYNIIDFKENYKHIYMEKPDKDLEKLTKMLKKNGFK